jgi:hypothetical protein
MEDISTLENKIKLGAYLWDVRRKGKYKNNFINFRKYLKQEHAYISPTEAIHYIDLYVMCAYNNITLQNIQGISWKRIKLFLKKITKENKDAMLKAAKEMSEEEYEDYIFPNRKIFMGKNIIIHIPAHKYALLYKKFHDVKDLHKFAYMYEVLEFLLKEDKDVYYKNEKLTNLLDQMSLDDILEYVTKKYPHTLIEVTELEG